MKEIMVKNGNKKLAIPQIGCGLDGLKWDIVRAIVKDIFQETDVEIVVYIYEEKNEDSDIEDFLGQISSNDYVNSYYDSSDNRELSYEGEGYTYDR